MAFFLVPWLVAATTKEQRAAISEYFRNPSPLAGKSPAPSPGMAGPGGASTSMIKLGGTADLQRGDNKDPFGSKSLNGDAQSNAAQRAKEKQRLEALMQDLKEAIDKSQALEPFKDQLLLDLTPDGLRIQIVDKENRPMFDIGSAVLKPYTRDILHELSGSEHAVALGKPQSDADTKVPDLSAAASAAAPSPVTVTAEDPTQR